MKLYRTELDSGLNNTQKLIKSSALGLGGIEEALECSLNSDKTSTGYRIYGNVFCQIKLSCDRCLCRYKKKIKTALNILLTNNKDIVREKNADVIMFTMSDDFVDLSSILHDIIMVEKPFKSLCGDNCKGICPSCGLDLNLDQCKCEKNSSIDEFEKLRDLIE